MAHLIGTQSVASATAAACAVAWIVCWLFFLLQLWRMARRIPELTPGAVMDSRPLPHISIIVAAKDEEQNIDACLRSLLSQHYGNYELIVVDDRSTDRTPTLLAKLEEEFRERIKIVSIEQLPDGWGGQNHALYRGVLASSGEWLCFTDADCRFESRHTLTIAVHATLRDRLDMLSILPTLITRSWWEKLYLPICTLTLLTALRIAHTNDAGDRAAYANGAFILFRRDAYHTVGGHEGVRHLLNDDIALATLSKQAGLRVRVASNDGLLSTRMYGSLRGAWKGWTRNFRGTLQRSSRLLAASVAITGLTILPWVFLGIVTNEARSDDAWIPATFLWIAAIALLHAGISVIYRRYAISSGWSVLYLPGAFFTAAVLAWTALRSHRKQPTVWHGVGYGDTAVTTSRTEDPRDG